MRRMLGRDVLAAYVPISLSAQDIRRADLLLVMSRDLMHKDGLPDSKTYLFKEFFGLHGAGLSENEGHLLSGLIIAAGRQPGKAGSDPWPCARSGETVESAESVAVTGL